MDHRISSSSGSLDIVESFRDLVLVLVLVVSVVLIGAFSGFMSSSVAIKT